MTPAQLDAMNRAISAARKEWNDDGFPMCECEHPVLRHVEFENACRDCKCLKYVNSDASRNPLNWQDWSNAGRLLEEMSGSKDPVTMELAWRRVIKEVAELWLILAKEIALPQAICLAWCRMNGIDLKEQ